MKTGNNNHVSAYKKFNEGDYSVAQNQPAQSCNNSFEAMTSKELVFMSLRRFKSTNMHELSLVRQVIAAHLLKIKLQNNDDHTANDYICRIVIKNGDSAFCEILDAYKPVIINYAHKYQNAFDADFGDFESIGKKALYSAIISADISHPEKFKSNFTGRIHTEMYREYIKFANAYPIPEELNKRIIKIKQKLEENEEAPCQTSEADSFVERLAKGHDITFSSLVTVDANGEEHGPLDKLLCEPLDSDPVTITEKELLTKRIYKTICQLPAIQQKIVLLYFGFTQKGKFSYQAIADQLGISKPTVMKYCRQAVKSIQAQLIEEQLIENVA